MFTKTSIQDTQIKGNRKNKKVLMRTIGFFELQKIAHKKL